MITFNEALKIIDDNIKQITRKKIVSLKEVVGLVTSKDYYSDVDFPNFDKSAMDGYGVVDDSFDKYEVVGEVKAGEFKEFDLQNNQTIKIMTGAYVQSSIKKIIIHENTTCESNFIKVTTAQNAINICYKGEDLKKGALVIKKGSMIDPYRAGILASIGVSEVEVYDDIKIALLITGDELIPPEELPVNGKIRDINSYTLLNMIKNIPSAKVEICNVVRDTLDDVKNAFENVLKSESDIIIVSGGSSQGDYDYVLAALESLSAKIFFNKVKVKPGKPTIFAKKNDKLIFGLPGNPVSVCINFEVYVKNAIFKLLGVTSKPVRIYPKLSFDYKRKNIERKEFIPIEIVDTGKELLCEKIDYNGSGNIAAYNGVRFVMEVEAGIKSINKGEAVAARQIWKDY